MAEGDAGAVVGGPVGGVPAKHFGVIPARLLDATQLHEQVREMKEISESSYVPALAFVIAYEGLSQNELAIEMMQRSCANRETNLVCIKSWPHFDGLRHDPRFQEIERRVGLRP